MNTRVVRVTNVMDVETGRKNALHNYVLGDAKLMEGYHERIDKDLLNMTTTQIIEAMDDFIKERGIAILDEAPCVVLDEMNNRYRVDVMYTIAV